MRGLIVSFLILVLVLLVGTMSYRTGVQDGHYRDTNDAWNAGYVDGWNNHEKYGTCHVND